MDKQWPYPDTGRQIGSPGDKPHYIKALARLRPLSRISTDKGREKLWSHIQAIIQKLCIPFGSDKLLKKQSIVFDVMTLQCFHGNVIYFLYLCSGTWVLLSEKYRDRVAGRLQNCHWQCYIRSYVTERLCNCWLRSSGLSGRRGRSNGCVALGEIGRGPEGSTMNPPPPPPPPTHTHTHTHPYKTLFFWTPRVSTIRNKMLAVTIYRLNTDLQLFSYRL